MIVTGVELDRFRGAWQRFREAHFRIRDKGQTTHSNCWHLLRQFTSSSFRYSSTRQPPCPARPVKLDCLQGVSKKANLRRLRDFYFFVVFYSVQKPLGEEIMKIFTILYSTIWLVCCGCTQGFNNCTKNTCLRYWGSYTYIWTIQSFLNIHNKHSIFDWLRWLLIL